MAKPRLHFIENQQEAVAIRQLPQPSQIAMLWLDNPNILQDRLGNQTRHRVALAHIGYRGQVIEIHGMHQFLVCGRNPGADGLIGIFPWRYPGAQLVQRGH